MNEFPVKSHIVFLKGAFPAVFVIINGLNIVRDDFSPKSVCPCLVFYLIAWVCVLYLLGHAPLQSSP